MQGSEILEEVSELNKSVTWVSMIHEDPGGLWGKVAQGKFFQPL